MPLRVGASKAAMLCRIASQLTSLYGSNLRRAVGYALLPTLEEQVTLRLGAGFISRGMGLNKSHTTSAVAVIPEHVGRQRPEAVRRGSARSALSLPQSARYDGRSVLIRRTGGSAGSTAPLVRSC